MEVLLVLGAAAALQGPVPIATAPSATAPSATAPSATTLRVPTQPLAVATSPPPPQLPTSVSSDPYEVLRSGYDREQLINFFLKKPASLLGRAATFARVYAKLKRAWERDAALPAEERTAGAVLREEVAKLGPVAVKLGQTLSQRPDVVGEDVCDELKSLQTMNTPFANEKAWEVIREELHADGRPIAPGEAFLGEHTDPEATPIFARLTSEPIASASLGQVYRGCTHDGVEIAVKVQRPGAVRQVALDFAVLVVALQLIAASGWGNGDLDEIVDICADGVFQELDYKNEEANAIEFKESMKFLGYVDVPGFRSEYTSSRVLVSEWVYGRHLDQLSTAEGLRMTYMAVEAVTVSLVLTGIVHADPH